ncbi:nucleoporin Nup43 [Coccinella septempunctata]|uniref:nucleoporin Nup43 n=1 Tax=Coccinella septempunctata TaxID=41139 RepID=UPI001D0773D7|nr:nucleoporin Nup43 [Coccinella septempunctata]
MANNIQGTFVSQKINKIRWRPDPFNNSHSFISCSWDDERNSVKLWDFRENDESEVYPFIITEMEHEGDITEAMFLSTDHFVCSSSLGSVGLFKISYSRSSEITIEPGTQWKNIHKFPFHYSPCTSITNYDQDIVSVGEDGRINLLTLSSESVVRSYENADSCSLKCVLFLKHNEILTSNLRGQMKIWDLRSKSEEPSSMFVLSGDMIAPTCLTYHPTQRHLVVAGDEEGSITIWDLRQNTFPVNLLKAHNESVTEIKFHPDYPDHLFSASMAGEVWHWSIKSKSTSTLMMAPTEKDDSNVWFASDGFKNKLEVYSLMDRLHKPINTFDVNQRKMICGCDNEAIYLINDIKLY